MARLVGSASVRGMCFALAVLFTVGTSWAIQVPPSLDTCNSLPACLDLLDKVVPQQDTGEGSNSEVLARNLRRFGEPAKQELLRRAVGNQPGWRNVAGAILSAWDSWTADDVPALRAALQLDHGGWVARPLGQIGSPDAIRALVDDLSAANDFENQTGFTLSKLGAKATPYLLPLLEDDTKYQIAAGVIAEIKPPPVSSARSWAEVAIDAQRSIKERMAALRGIAAIGPAAQQAGTTLHMLLADRSPKIAKQTKETLIAVRDPVVVEDLAKGCKPQATQFDFLALNSSLCLREIADFGPEGRAAGKLLMPFLDSGNGAERAYGILTLGYIGYEPAMPKITAALDSKDWRIVYAAIWASGWLGTKDAISKLDELASSYWLAELRGYAANSAAALRYQAGRLNRRPWNALDHGFPSDPTYVITDGVRGQQESCPGDLWVWQDETFKMTPRKNAQAHSLDFRNQGDTVGTDHGEWGGELTWIPKQGVPVVLIRDNVRGMEYDSNGVIVLFGLAHMSFDYGYTLRVSRNSDGTWTESEIARLPGEPQNWTKLKSDRIAALAANRVIVFSSKEGILGVASCASGPPK